jgi:uncharacterized DUF497 family protein
MRTPVRFGNLESEKNARNIRERDIDFASVRYFAFETAVIFEDDRRDYGEERLVALGFLAGRMHVLVFTMRGRRVSRHLAA